MTALLYRDFDFTAMGWFTTSKVETPAVSREDRKKCWENRDDYFGCLDRAGVLEPGKEGNACPTEKSRYEASCAKSWASRSLILLLRRLTLL